jgi:hypothetical protein
MKGPACKEEIEGEAGKEVPHAASVKIDTSAIQLAEV